MKRYQNNLDILKQLSEMLDSKNVELNEELTEQEVQRKAKYVEAYKKLLHFYNSELFTLDFYTLHDVFTDFLSDSQDKRLKNVGLGKVDLDE